MKKVWLFIRNVGLTLNQGACALIPFLLLLSSCAPILEVGVGYPLRDDGFEGDGPALNFRLRNDFNKLVWCEYQHISYITEGPPFNDRPEDTLDLLGCGIRIQAAK